MSAALHAFHFLQPAWLAGLALLPMLWWWLGRRRRTDAALARLVDRALLAPQLRGGGARGSLAPWLQLGAWLLAILALAGPTWSRQPQPLYTDRAVQIVALSLSSHMRAHDVVPSRLQRARLKVRDLLNANGDGLNALVAYAGEAFVVAPLTSDAHSLDDLLAALTPDTMPVDGDNAAAAIERAVTLARDAKAPDASLVLVTDQADRSAQQAARAARAAGVRVSVLGVGTTHGGPMTTAGGALARDAQGNVVLAARDDAALAAVAAAGGGRYVPMTARGDDIQVLRGQLQTPATAAHAMQSGVAWVDRGPWLLLPLLLLVALHFRRGWLCLLALTLLPAWPGAAQAGSWTDWWQRPDQQAAAALRQGDARRAQVVARDPAWRAAADYRAGDYAAAARTLRDVPGAPAAYNRGNALARSGDYAAALHAYDQALRLAPHMADAAANRQAVADWLARQPPAQKPPASPPQHQTGRADQSGKTGQPDSSGKSGQPNPSGQSGEPTPSGQPSESDPSDKPDKSGQPTAADTTQPSSGANASPANQNAGAAQPNQALPAGGASVANTPTPSSPETERPGTPAASASAAAPPTARGAREQQAMDAPPPSAQEQARQRAQATQAQAAVRRQMDAALADKPPPGSAAAHDLGAPAPGVVGGLPLDVRRVLQTVPDDPGALLRRKFELEYQRRHGNVPTTEDQP